MACEATWTVVPGTLDDIGDDERLFFDEHQWLTIEAATARIIPTDHDPGAREAGVARFIDLYLSGIKYIYASADGSGFLELDGALAESWREHIAELQALYADGIRRIERLASELFDTSFSELSDEEQDQVLVELSGTPKPEPMASLESRGSGYGFALQSDVGLDFFSTLCLHTRQGFYCDPVYGGNRDRIGWAVIGFPGPERLVDTQTCSYSLEHLLVSQYDWSDLVPHLRAS
jgi:gluconate 2-dehydrogenase gamma chain